MQDEEKQAYRIAYAKLAKRSLHSNRLRKMLQEKGISSEICETVIERLRTQGFLDDAQYVTYFVQKWQKMGKSRLEIAKKALIQAIPHVELKQVLTDDNQSLKGLIEKKYPVLLQKDGDRKLKEKAIRSLLLKGFSFEIINQNRV